MRPRLRSRASWFVAVLAAALAGRAGAQSGTYDEGALDLLVPTGARAVGMGQAAVAQAQGADAIWWNPALLARDTKREFAFNYTQSFFSANDNAIAVVLPIAQVGTLGFNARYIDYGQEEATDASGTTGLISTSTTIAGGSFSSVIGGVAVGLNLKLYRAAFSCSGACPALPVSSASTSALDFGAQYPVVIHGQPISFGLAVRNVGQALQVNDAPQADPLPGRVEFGVASTPHIESMPDDVALEFAADVVSRLSGLGGPGFRTGGELSFQKRYALRLGYVLYGPTGSGASFGLGLNTGKLQIDLARFITDLTTQSGQPPTFLSLRYVF